MKDAHTNNMNVEQTLAELVRIDSRSSVSNLAVVEYAAPRLEALGFCARVYPYTDEQGVKKYQLVAVYPKTFEDGEQVELALVGHTDTVKKPQNLCNFSLSKPTAVFERTCFLPSFTQGFTQDFRG